MGDSNDNGLRDGHHSDQVLSSDYNGEGDLFSEDNREDEGPEPVIQVSCEDDLREEPPSKKPKINNNTDDDDDRTLTSQDFEVRFLISSKVSPVYCNDVQCSFNQVYGRTGSWGSDRQRRR